MNVETLRFLAYSLETVTTSPYILNNLTLLAYSFRYSNGFALLIYGF